MALPSAAPWEVDAAVRRAAADALGADPRALPPADPRREKGTLRLTSALALRLAKGAGTGPERLARGIAARLEGEDGIARASAAADGRLTLEPEPALFGALVRTARNGAFHLGAGRRRAFPAPGAPDAPDWALTDLCGLPAPSAARAAARDDARRRLRWLLEGERKGGQSAERGEPAAEAGWREPLADRPCGGSATALLLAAVGEASARIAFCRSLSEHPRPGELTGPGLPALPTADAPGAWARFTADNPAFAVRYAHAHAVTALRRGGEDGEEEGRDRAPCALPSADGPAADPAGLVGALYDGPGAAAAAGRRGRPHMLVRYLEGLATAYHVWAETRDGAGGPGERAADRQDTRAAVAAVLGAGLLLLGVTAPTRL
ncbi:DALR anticodon-binding domain-containing protein [Nocardiopsis baichengensis]|uniref:DALR anticodon-binding domain-containing protein n=1 Tax=Nocardiopsis baichengensis TaxID=280240 RepID=UPI00034BD75B|nr:DALR anticodon-binding domain-containing protein [Nocardiopsis baichengensis]